MLGKYVHVEMGQSPKGETVNPVVGEPLLNGPTEFGPRYPHPVQFTTQGARYAEPGDLLFCVRGSTTGRMNWADRRYVIGRGLAALRHKFGADLQPFVRGVIELRLPTLLVQATGSTFPNVSRTQLEALEYPEISLEEQRRIAHILGTFDDKIELNRQMSETLEEMAQALFKSWFVDFDPVRAKAEGRDTGLPSHVEDIFPDRLVDSDLGAIPADWQIVPLEEICNVGIGKTPPRKEPEWFTYWGGEGVPWASVKDLASAAPFLDRTREQLTSAAIDRHRVRVAPAGSILLSFKLTIGRVAVTSVDMATNEAIAQIQLKEVAPGGGEYLRHYLSTFDYSSLGNTSSIATALNSRLIRGLQVVLPPDNVLRAFSAAVGVAQERQRVLLENARTLTEARDALLRNLIG